MILFAKWLLNLDVLCLKKPGGTWACFPAPTSATHAASVSQPSLLQLKIKGTCLGLHGIKWLRHLQAPNRAFSSRATPPLGRIPSATAVHAQRGCKSHSQTSHRPGFLCSGPRPLCFGLWSPLLPFAARRAAVPGAPGTWALWLQPGQGPPTRTSWTLGQCVHLQRDRCTDGAGAQAFGFKLRAGLASWLTGSFWRERGFLLQARRAARAACPGWALPEAPGTFPARPQWLAVSACLFPSFR